MASEGVGVADKIKIHVKSIETNEIVKTLEATTENQAERIERGLLINMDRERYFVDVVYPGEGEL